MSCLVIGYNSGLPGSEASWELDCSCELIDDCARGEVEELADRELVYMCSVLKQCCVRRVR